jgi:hypothetical protein
MFMQWQPPQPEAALEAKSFQEKNRFAWTITYLNTPQNFEPIKT